MMGSFLLIDRPEALRAFIDRALGSPWLGVDTEFVRDRHYYPRAGLIQIATPKEIGLIDPVRLEDLSLLVPLLLEPRAEKILHAARQDLELLLRLFGEVPTPLFDTQVAAARLGMASQMGYAALAEELLDERPEASLGHYDWLKRPLAPEALTYAAADVRHLRQMRDILTARLGATALLDPFRAAMRDLEDAERYRPQPSRAWRRVRSARRLGGLALDRLKRLAEWREEQAMAEDRPRQWIVRDAALVAIARRAPVSAAELAQISDLGPVARRRYSEALLAVTAAGPES